MKKRMLIYTIAIFTYLAIVLITPSAIVIDVNDGALSLRYDASAMPPPPENIQIPAQNTTPTLPPSPTPAPTPMPTPEPEPEPELEPEPTPEPVLEPPPVVTLTISAAGDTTLGGCPVSSSYNHFMVEFSRNDEDMSFFLRNVRHIFMAGDLTLLNLECALTDETRHKGRKWNYKGDARMAEALSNVGLMAVSLANNHTDDFLEKGYQDTKDNLNAFGVEYFGNETNTILEINGIKVGLYGYLAWTSVEERTKTLIRSSVADLRERGAQVIIGYFHWGFDRANVPNPSQIRLGRFAIDNGTDLVLGAHPHVMQGIEVYKGKNIVYSLGNFAYGGHYNPEDMDTFIFQQTFTFINGVLQDTNETNIIPAYISSLTHRNNYQPTPAEGTEAERILERIERYSQQIGS